MSERDEVVAGSGRRWWIEKDTAINWLDSLPADCADLVVTSPPYVQAREYLEDGENLGIARKTDDWVEWMSRVVFACLRVCRGPVVVVCEGQQVDFRYDVAPFLLLADLARAGVCCRKPAVYHRVGIPGRTDAWRNDWEPVLLFTRGGRLPWSNPTACGHPPKYGPGGDPSHRTQNGERVNVRKRKVMTRERPGMHSQKSTVYKEPEIANPGNVIWVPPEVVRDEQGDIISVAVGGGKMGHRLASENEAPYPEDLVYPFVVSFCPPGGLVLDPFSGSGTTVAVAVGAGRRGLGCDLRQSQVDLGRRRVLEVTPPLPGMEP